MVGIWHVSQLDSNHGICRQVALFFLEAVGEKHLSASRGCQNPLAHSPFLLKARKVTSLWQCSHCHISPLSTGEEGYQLLRTPGIILGPRDNPGWSSHLKVLNQHLQSPLRHIRQNIHRFQGGGHGYLGGAPIILLATIISHSCFRSSWTVGAHTPPSYGWHKDDVKCCV